MVLEVEFIDFATEAKERFAKPVAYLADTSTGLQVTAGDSATEFILFARSSLSRDAAKAALEKEKITVRHGAWIGEEEMALHAQLLDSHVAAVAYKSSEDRPGLWVEAFANEPTHNDVLSRIFTEFQGAGLTGKFELDDFIRIADPTIVILSPEQLRAFATRSAELVAPFAPDE